MKKIISCILLLALIITAFASCGTVSKELQAAKDYLYAKYKDDAVVTPSDYEVVGMLIMSDVTYTVEWTVNVTDGVKVVPVDEKAVTIDVNEKSDVEVAYTLTATIKDPKGKSVTVSFDHKVPAFKESNWNEYVAAGEGDTVVVKGVVTAIMAKSKGNSYNCLYFQDSDGGYYAYNMSSDPVTDDKIEVGMTVRVTGSRSTYSGTYEIMSGTVEILDSTVNPATPVDFTDKYLAATSLKDTALVAQQGMLVTVKGVEITGEDVSGGYYKFKLGALESYIRISSSVCPITKDEQTKFKADHASHLGWTANATGIICVYDGAFYLTPMTVDAFEYISLPAKDDAGMVEFEKGNLTFETSVSESKEFTLVTTGPSYSAVKITWASESEFAVISEDGTKLTVTIPDSDTSVRIVATITSGAVTETKEFDVTLVASEMTYGEIVTAAYALEENASMNGTYRLCGKVTEINTAYDEKYKNVTVTIAVEGMDDKTIQCFRLKGEGCEAIAVGDVITVEGVIKNYKGTVEFDAGCVFVGKGEILDQSKTVNAAYALASGASMSAPVVLKGTVSSIDTAYSEQYGNITVKIVVDGLTDKPIVCYRLTGDGADKLAVGDEIAVLGTIKNYNGTVEFDKGCVIVPVTDMAQIKTVLASYKLASGKALASTRTLTGTITEIGTEYSEQYGNITVTIVAYGMKEFPIVCFRLKGEGADKLAVGDVITVTGTIKNYKDTIEFDAGCTFVK